jgi:hypothetical protein
MDSTAESRTNAEVTSSSSQDVVMERDAASLVSMNADFYSKADGL